MVLVNIRIRDPASCNDVWVKSSNYDAWKHAGSSGAKGGIGKGKRGRRLLKAQGSEIQKRALPGKRKEGDRKVMNKILKRLLSVVLAVVMVIGLVPLSGVTTVEAAGETKTIYLDTTAYNQNNVHGWQAAYIHLFNDGGEIFDDAMKLEKQGVYSYEVDTSKYTKVVFKPNSGDNWDGKTKDLTIPTGSENMFYCTNFDKETTGTWRIYNGGSGESDSSTFYVQADLIDYYNDNRVGIGDSPEHRNDNQGAWTGPDNAPYSKLNTWISSLDGYAIPPIETNGDGTRTIYWDNGRRTGEVYIYYWGGTDSNRFIKMEQVETNSPIYQGKIPANSTHCLFSSVGNFDNDENKLTGDLELTRFNLYTFEGSWSFYGDASASAIPLYFGDLFHRKQLTGDDNGTVNEFYRGANVAFSNNTNAVAQGIVGEHLVNGKLVTSYSDEVFVPFFEEGAYEGQSDYMTFYKNLQFPFKTETDRNVTKYSFDSKEQTVYYDYENHSIESSNNVIEDASTSHSRGYFPFNQYNPTDKSELNYGFGTKFTIPFTINTNGKDANNEDITFNFTGDDDVWVFIDDALVLDMGGAHELAEGTINFATQTATVSASADATTDYNVYGGNSSYVSNSKEQVNFSEITVRLSNGTKTTLSEYMQRENTVHTLTMYYMERGMHNSNMSIDFSFIPLPSGMSLNKQVNTANVNAGLKTAVERIDTFDFEIKTKNLKVPESTLEPVQNLGYTVRNRSNNSSMSGQVADNGVVRGLNSSIYAHNFINTKTQGKAFYAGTEFEITEIIPENSILEYESTEWKVYDGSNTSTPDEEGKDKIAKFSMGDEQSTEFEVYTKYVYFTNTPKVAPVTLTKSWATGAAEDGDTFELEVLVDLDGEGSAYDYAPYALAYSYSNSSKENGTTGADGKLTLSSGETVEFPGIPVGAKVKVTETQEENAYWEAVDGVYSDEVTVSESEDNSLGITNTTKAVTLDKVIYVEAGKDGGTDYTIKDGENTVKVETAKPTEGIPEGELTVTVTDEGVLNVNPIPANKAYEVEYTGCKDNGVGVSGKITVHTYALTDDVYVFDYGLKSDLADTTHGNGMFQNDNLFINGVDTTAKLTELDDSALTQSTINLEGNSSTPLDLEKYESTSGAKLKDNNKVIFEPTAFMDKQETATYGTTVYAPGKETVQSPEDGVVLSDADVKVMPANVVYYEDNFDGIEYTGSESAVDKSEETSSLQSNANNTTHGYDIVYNDSNNDSDGTITTLTRTDDEIPTFSFKFKGSGFDIVGRTSTETAILTVVVEDIIGTKADGTPETEVKSYGVVDTYYANGNLYQIPVISVRDLDVTKEHIVSVAVVKSSNEYNPENNVFYLDGIRIYNPMQDTSEYQESEQNVKFENVHNLLVGDGNISEDVYKKDGAIIKVSAEGSKMVLVQYDEDAKKAVLYRGSSNSENQDGLEGDSTYSASLVDYLNKGPNNEVYLDPGVGIAFDITGESLSNIKTIQVEAKKVDITSEEQPISTENAFSLMNVKGELIPVNAKVESKTAMYYNIPVESCIQIENGYRVILIANDTVSLSNIKYTNNCSLKVPEVTDYLCKITVTPGQDVYDAKIETATLSPTAQGLKAGKRVTVASKLDDTEDFDHFNIYMIKDYNKVEECLTEEYLQESKPASKTDKYKYSFYAPKEKGQYTLVIIPVNSKNEESCYYKSIAVTVK